MINRLTRPLDEWPCRIAEGCPAEEWIEEVTGLTVYNWEHEDYKCGNCPFEKYINRLAEFEDEAEYMEDDRK